MTTPYTEEDVEAVARAIWRSTYVHDTLLPWCEIKRGTMHHTRTLTAACAALDTLIQRGWRKGECGK